jgi:hypothetical protein
MKTSAAFAALALGLAVASPAFAQVKLEKGVTADNKKCDRITWLDANGKDRIINIVADNDKEKQSAGYICDLSYDAGEKQRREGKGTFGHLVMHGAKKNPGWANSLSDTAKVRCEPVFEGPNHALYRAVMDINSDKGLISATVDYFVRAGRSDFLWAVTFDTSKVEGMAADTRSPYVEFDWEGVPPGGQGGDLSGMGWAAADKQFRTLGDKVSGNSKWDWTKDCIIPHIIEWKTGALGDAELGLVQTQTYKQHDAGGGWWMQAGKSGTKLPENWNLTYQLNAYQGYSSKRATWMMPYGAVGSKTYKTYDNKNAVGFPYQSYAVFCILDKYSEGGTDAAIAEMTSVQTTCKLEAAVGAVAEKGPAGAGRTDEADYKPAGWDPIYATWNVACKDNAADCSLTTGEGGSTLYRPTFVFTHYTAAAAPTTITLDGAPAKAGTALVSLDKAGQRLFVTLTTTVKGKVQIAFTGPKN